MKRVFLFPGQGSQVAGMGRNFYEQSPEAREIFRLADEVLGFSLSRLCFEGPEEELRLSCHTQPALLTVSYIAYRSAWTQTRPGCRAQPRRVFSSGGGRQPGPGPGPEAGL